ncbi:MAG: lipopolysaccharide biosynthesis protein [Cyanobacteriota bacterium]|nr:lipopolysaccharide biosynthesis protein [Cyanobacteriota bacterium]
MVDLRRGWLHLAGGAGLGRIASFLSNLALTRLLGPADLGLFNLVATTVQTGDTLVRLGGDFALNYELGGEAGALHTPRGRSLTAAFSVQTLLATAVMLAGLALWLGPGHGLFPPSLAEPQRRLWGALLLLMVGLEAICAVPWEVLLVAGDTRRLALRQGVFLPLRLALAAVGAAWGQVGGALIGWTLVALIQPLWLAGSLRGAWPPPRDQWQIPWPVWRQLLRRGLPFYGANLLSSLVFFPLLLNLASRSGLADVGFLRIGQILQQLFALLPGTLVPVLFLRLRQAESFHARMRQVERVFRLLWSLLLFVLLAYGLVDGLVIRLFFGASYLPSLGPTRIMLMTSLVEVLLQILIQPLMSSGLMRRYALLVNGGTLLAALVGWVLVPRLGLQGFLIAKYLVAILPLLPLLAAARETFDHAGRLLPLLLMTVALTLYLFAVDLLPFGQGFERPLFGLAMAILVMAYQRDYRELLGNAYGAAAP